MVYFICQKQRAKLSNNVVEEKKQIPENLLEW